MAMTRLGYSPYRRTGAARTASLARQEPGAGELSRGEPGVKWVVEGSQ